MGILGLFKKKVSDPDMCMFRDLYTIAFGNDGSKLSKSSMDIIAESFKAPLNLDMMKGMVAMKADPDTIKDCYPIEKGKRDAFLKLMILLWVRSGNLSKATTKQYIYKVAKKLGYSDRDIHDEFEAMESCPF